MNEIYNREAASFLKEGGLDNRVQLVVTSPPYDDIRKYNGYEFDSHKMFVGIRQALKEGGVCVWIMTDQTKNGARTGTSFRHAIAAQEAGLSLHDTMIWRKTNPLPGSRGSRYIDCFEFMFVFAKGKPSVFNPLMEPCKSAGVKASFRYSRGNKKQEKRSLMVAKERPRWNIWDCSASATATTKHPAVFPLRLAADHILTWSNVGDLVLDPMCGSGTTCLAARQLGREFVGIDISKEYCLLTKSRLEQEMC